MRIAIVIFSPRFFGGGSKFACDLSLSLMERGAEVAICAWETPIRGYSHEGFFKIQHWFTPRLGWNLGKLYKIALNQRLTLRRLVKNFRPDVIIGADTEPSVMLGQKAKRVMYVHFPTELKVYKHSLAHLLYRSVYWWRHYKALSEMDAIVCNSEYTRQITYLVWKSGQPNKEKYSVIYPCVDVKKFGMKMGRKPYKVCYVGRLDENKGIDRVLDAFKRVKKEVPEATLDIVGGVRGSPWAERYYPKLLKKSQELEDLTIKRDAHEHIVVETLLASRCMASYNPEEHFGIVPIEAMAAGCPPIVADGGGQRETVLDGETGFLTKSPEELAVHMKKLLTDERLFKAISEKARIHARKFDREVLTKRWVELIESIM